MRTSSLWPDPESPMLTLDQQVDLTQRLISKGEQRRLGRQDSAFRKIIFDGRVLEAEVQGRTGSYTTRITFNPPAHRCTCPDWEQNGRRVGPCKHVLQLAQGWSERLIAALERGASNRTASAVYSDVGFYIPLPEDLASQFPDLSPEDTTPPHVTLLYVGPVAKERKGVFLATASQILGMQPGPVTAALTAPDFFRQPARDLRVWFSSVRFSKDVATVRDRLWNALLDEGFEVQHAFPLAFVPHVTLEYQPGAQRVDRWHGPVPMGVWTFSSVSVWGLGHETEIPLGNYSKGDSFNTSDLGWRYSPRDEFQLPSISRENT
jgi:2'-5' RNA ligase